MTLLLFIAASCLTPTEVITIYRDCKWHLRPHGCFVDRDEDEYGPVGMSMVDCDEALKQCLKLQGWERPVCRPKTVRSEQT